jgi:hypothetical protein
MATEANRTDQAEIATSDCTRRAPFVISVILLGILGVQNARHPLLSRRVLSEIALREGAGVAFFSGRHGVSS